MGLNTTVVFAAWDTSVNVLPNSVSFTFKYTDPKNNTQSKNVTGKSIVVDGLTPDTVYQVEISVAPGLESSNVLESNFTTLAEGADEDLGIPLDDLYFTREFPS